MVLTVDPETIQYPSGLEIVVKGYAGDNALVPSQVFIEVYEGKLQIHIWDGSSEDPCQTQIIPKLKEETEDSDKV